MRISLTGFMGSGKSRYGEKLAQVLSVSFYDLDKEIEQKEGRPVAGIFEKEGEQYFRKIESEVLQGIMQKDNFVLSCGGGVPLRQENRNLLNRQSFVIFLKPQFQVIADYLKKNLPERPLISHLEPVDFNEQLKKIYQPRLVFYREARLVIDPGFINPVQIINYLPAEYTV